MNPKAASRSLRGHDAVTSRYNAVASVTTRRYYEVTTVTTRSLRGHYGHYAVTRVTTQSLRSLRGQKKHMFEAEKTLNFAPKGLFDQEIVAVDLEFH